MELLNRNRYLIDDRKDIFIVSILDLLLSFVSIFRKKRSFKDLNNILIIKPCHLGDVLMLTAVLPLIKKRYNHAVIDIVIGEWAEVVLKDNPYIRKKHIVNHCLDNLNRKRKSYLGKVKEFIMTFVKSLLNVRREAYDVCINMRKYKGNLTTFSWLSKSCYCIGYGTSGFGPVIDYEAVWEPNIHEVEYFFKLLEPLGIYAGLEDIRYELYPSQDDDEFVNKIIEDMGLKEFTVVHPFSGDIKRMLSSDFWARLIDIEEGVCVICGGNNERDYYNNIQKKCTKKLIDLLGKFTIQQLFLFYKKARMIYSVESLSSHIAAMTDARTVSFYTCNPVQWRPLGKNVTVVMDAQNYLDNLEKKTTNRCLHEL